jgi:hypothetical protein
MDTGSSTQKKKNATAKRSECRTVVSGTCILQGFWQRWSARSRDSQLLEPSLPFNGPVRVRGCALGGVSG